MKLAAVQNQPQSCSFCGLPLPSHPVEGAAEKRYCCHGCAHMEAILAAVGADTDEGKQRLSVARASGLVSSPLTAERPAVELPDTVREEQRLQVDQMACPSCAWLVEEVIARQPGVAAAEVDFYSDTVKVVFDLSKTSVEEIAAASTRAGYPAAPMERGNDAADNRELWRLGVAFAVYMNLMMLAWVGYEVFFPAGGAWVGIVDWLQVISAVPVVTWAALPLYRRALAAIAQGRVVMETLLSLGIIAATALSAYEFISGSTRLYLESATALVTLSLAGRWLERWIKRRTAGALTGLLTFAPTKARMADSGAFKPLKSLVTGDRIRVLPGETVPLDLRAEQAVIVRESLLTGEPHPVSRPADATILAGSVAEGAGVTGVVLRPAAESVAEKMRERVFTALRSADAGSRMADRLAQGFVPLVVIVAIVSFIGHVSAGGGFEHAALTAVSVLVISCPCAFGVAASSALSLAVLRLASAGVLVKEPQVIEAAAGLKAVIFDKTGTLTRGDLSLAGIGWTAGEQPDILAAVARLEADSRHPIGIALARLLADRATADNAEGTVEIPGMGITGTLSGLRYAAGTAKLFAPLARPVPSPEGIVTRVWFGFAGEEPSGWFDIADAPRSEAAAVAADLHARGLATLVFSGDDQRTTDSVALAVGIGAARGNMLPEEKAAAVHAESDARGSIAFVGDGFNDAEALAAADIGFALAGGAELALVSAPVVITRADLRGLNTFLDTARTANRVLRGNFIWAFLYNVALIPVAAFGLLSPIYAALLMALSSASVGFNSMRLRKTGRTTIQLQEAITG